MTATPPLNLAAYHYADTRAHRALHSTVTGENMADWGPQYIAEAKAIMRRGSHRGRLWQLFSVADEPCCIEHKTDDDDREPGEVFDWIPDAPEPGHAWAWVRNQAVLYGNAHWRRA